MHTAYTARDTMCKNKKENVNRRSLLIYLNYYARSTAPLLRQEVQTYIFFEPPSVLTFTDLIFGFHILFDLLCEWLTAFPKYTPLPHTEHFAIAAPPYII